MVIQESGLRKTGNNVWYTCIPSEAAYARVPTPSNYLAYLHVVHKKPTSHTRMYSHLLLVVVEVLLRCFWAFFLSFSLLRPGGRFFNFPSVLCFGVLLGVMTRVSDCRSTPNQPQLTQIRHGFPCLTNRTCMYRGCFGDTRKRSSYRIYSSCPSVSVSLSLLFPFLSCVIRLPTYLPVRQERLPPDLTRGDAAGKLESKLAAVGYYVPLLPR